MREIRVETSPSVKTGRLPSGISSYEKVESSSLRESRKTVKHNVYYVFN